MFKIPLVVVQSLISITLSHHPWSLLHIYTRCDFEKVAISNSRWIFFPPQIPPPWQQQVNQTQDGGAKTHCEPAVESYVHILRSAARRPQQCLPGAHCVGQRSPGQQCFPGRSQARSWHRCVFSLIRSKSCSKFQTRWLKTSETLHGSLCTKELCSSTGAGWFHYLFYLLNLCFDLNTIKVLIQRNEYG